MKPPTTEYSAGAILVATFDGEPGALLIRVRSHGYEIPKGHIEPGESSDEAALRELREEAGIKNPVFIKEQLGILTYQVEKQGVEIVKHVTYFLAVSSNGDRPEFGPRPAGTREIKWVKASDLADVPLVNGQLAELVSKAIAAAGERG